MKNSNVLTAQKFRKKALLQANAGVAEVASTAYPDATQFDSYSHYFDPKLTVENPRWILVDVKAIRKTRLLSLAEMRSNPDLASMVVLQKGSRLSITPVTATEWKAVLKLLDKPK
ncbi:EVE domain-containing protein [Undibacterium macrobrachii]|uniref:EVE domain-containing protein n=1 Tax=Undibacterium macrobrachii TaxID=1119058 RepID=UPI0027E56F31|nr:EVE domain-containing protein [Undibacterium macrobrachii]